MSRLRQWLERAYSIVRLPGPVFLTLISWIATTNVRWKGEGGGDDGVSEPAESRSTEIQLGSAKEI